MGATSGGSDIPSQSVLVSSIRTEITPVVADYVEQTLQRAQQEGYAAYVIQLDTPGGLATSMRDIVQDILGSRTPVIVYVSPEGARAASAGAVITLAAHAAVMAPGTSIGAATPVGMQGEDLGAKVVNDAAAQAEALARLRDRNVEFAGAMVRKGRSIGVTEAVRLGVVDDMASTLQEALAKVNGRKVQLAGDRTTTLRTSGAEIVHDDWGLLRQVQQFLANPNLAYLLLMLGMLGILYELASPGIGVAGIIGAVSLVLALFSLAVLPVNAAGLLLLLIAAGLFVAELFAPGIAGFAIGGGVVLVLAAIFLFDEAQGVRVDPMVALPTAVLVVILAIIAGRLVYRTRHGTAASGTAALIGRTARLDEAEGDRGRIFMDGAWWEARSTGGPLETKQQVRVVAVDGITLLVEPLVPDISPPDGNA
ncbi:NfeD family protein [Nonomuraea sp. 10N515B]|uniref:NfeD family protein n=1 Tax=Nonomuraea sp. 10N515B TaxID=3457422 RepID=UPI003FCCF4D5